ncbi:hypothetical protein LTR05_001247 [Lithohypha guttulata]|uniref:Trafficking protein particle complex subunit 11 n=1 Tax=Lithohypha guttulata TaxID=1690604 RepID=A0AAN7YEX5_9EURO|nr:hypothetical protein LTR05_001247 [Lithohypha guttulata]
MNSYPDDYVVHNLPLVILTGLEANSSAETPFGEKSFQFLGDGGFRIRAELPPLYHPLTADLRAALLAHDHSKAAWHSPSTDKTEQAHVFKIRSVGRAYTFPPRKAPPPPHSPRMRPSDDNGASPPPLTLHSTLSPLSPSSPLYPDGIITPLWITKHQYRLPSVLVSFYNLVSDHTTSSLEDNKIKSEVNAIRSLMTSTNYKTKFVIVLVADGPINHAALEERLVNIRRGTNFDSKALYYLPSTSSPADLQEFAKVMLNTLHPTVIEYYRDLSKHARRKRNRNTVPQPTIPPTQGTSAILSLQAWNARYEFKLGIFAETRQELEAASRNYEQAYEGLFHPELFETIPARSPRFNEARMLADVIAIRIIRCALWSSQTVTAVRWWSKHRARIRDLVDRRGMGTNDYGWHAWLAIWSNVMFELIQRAEVFQTAHSELPPGHGLPVQIVSDKTTLSLDHTTPWEALHHEGYWLDEVRRHIEARRELAKHISPDDRSIETTSALQSSRKHHYDTYLVPEPPIEYRLFDRRAGENYGKRICNTVDSALKHFEARDQYRMAEVLRYRQAMEQFHSDSESIVMLTSLWQQSSWRKQGWYSLLARVGKVLLDKPLQDDPELRLLLLWELRTIASDQVTPIENQMLEGGSAALTLTSSLPQIVPGLAFSNDTGHVGEPLAIQLSLRYIVPSLQADLQVKEIKFTFDGGIKPILLKAEAADDDAERSGGATIYRVELSEADASVEKVSRRLSLSGGSYWTGTIKTNPSGSCYEVYNFEVIPREPGPASVASCMLLLANSTQEITLSSGELNNVGAQWWELRDGSPISRDFGMHRDVTSVNVLPKPPKAAIKLPDLLSAYYTNEKVTLRVDILNDEDEALNGSLDVRLLNPSQDTLQFHWRPEISSGEGDSTQSEVASLKRVGPITPQEVGQFELSLTEIQDPMECELELKLSYRLESDGSQEVVTSVIVNLPVIRPFEATTFFLPRLHVNAWPNFFDATNVATVDQPQGLTQTYLVKADIGCFTQQPVVVRSLNLEARRIVGGAVCTKSLGRPKTSGLDSEQAKQVEPDTTEQFLFDLELQKLVLGERSPVAIDFVINIEWSRIDSKDVNISTLILPKFLVPMSEPRVLLQAAKVEGVSATCLLTYTIENPSMHFLTFNVNMESGEGFAFSGSKAQSVSLVPMSRYELRYRVLMQRSGEWVRVHLDVLDAFFGQTLKVQPASEGVRVDKQGDVQIWSG